MEGFLAGVEGGVSGHFWTGDGSVLGGERGTSW
jgi:hypothetical protein